MKAKKILSVLFFSLCLILSSCDITGSKVTSTEPLNRAVQPVLEADSHLDLDYVGEGNSRQTMDVYLPENRNSGTPVILFIHGGSWIRGQKEEFTPLCTEFQEDGFVTVTMNYRLTYKNGSATGITYIDILDDISSAIATIVENSNDWNISTNIMLVGFSAGAVNTALYAYTHNDGYVKTCVSLSGAYDLTDTNVEYLLKKANQGKEIVEMFTGGDAVAASPQFHISGENDSPVPTLIYHGSSDQFMSTAHVESFINALEIAGVTYEDYFFDGVKHAEYFLPNYKSNIDPTEHEIIVDKMKLWLATYY